MVSGHAQEVVEVARGPDDTLAHVWMRGRALVVWGLNGTISRLGAREEEGLVVVSEGVGGLGSEWYHLALGCKRRRVWWWRGRVVVSTVRNGRSR
jgi:hypothetical protein